MIDEENKSATMTEAPAAATAAPALSLIHIYLDGKSRTRGERDRELGAVVGRGAGVEQKPCVGGDVYKRQV